MGVKGLKKSCKLLLTVPLFAATILNEVHLFHFIGFIYVFNTSMAHFSTGENTHPTNYSRGSSCLYEGESQVQGQ